MPTPNVTNTKTAATITEIEQAIAAVRVFHARGVEDAKAGRQVRRAGTESEKVMIAKARAFSRQYSAEDLDRVLGRCRDAGWVLSVSHFTKLMTVQKGKHREELQEQAIRERWSTPRLNRVVRSLLGNRRPGSGRNPKVVSFADGLVQLVQIAEKWTKLRGRIQLHAGGVAEVGKKGTSRPAASPELTRKLEAVDESLEQLRKHVERIQRPKQTQ